MCLSYCTGLERSKITDIGGFEAERRIVRSVAGPLSSGAADAIWELSGFAGAGTAGAAAAAAPRFGRSSEPYAPLVLAGAGPLSFWRTRTFSPASLVVSP